MSFFKKSGSRFKKQPPSVEFLIHFNYIVNFAKTDLYPYEIGNDKVIFFLFSLKFGSNQQDTYDMF